MNMFRKAAIGFGVVAGMALAGALAGTLSSSTASAAEWDLPLVWPDGNFHTRNAKTFADEVARVTEGRVTINIHAGGSLGLKGPEMLNAIRDGIVPIGDILLSQQVGEAPLLGLETIPYLVGDFQELRALHRHFRPVVEEIAASYNQKVLYMVPWPAQYVYTKTEAKSLGDLKGIKIRTFNKATTNLFNAVGMTAVQLPWGEVVPSLAAGTIDSVTTSASSGVDGKFWEFLKFMYPTNHTWSSNAITVNLDAWKSLSEADRQAIEYAAWRLEPQFWEVSSLEDTSKRKLLNDNGVATGIVTAEMRDDMRKATVSQLDEYVSATPGAKEVLDAFYASVGR